MSLRSFIFLAITLLPTMGLGIEKPTYEIVEAWDEVEVRAYPSLVVARTRVDAAFDRVGSVGFRRLGGYIFGNNEADQKISMTAPVAQSPAGDNTYWVTFYMPAAYRLEDLPEPQDSDVNLMTLPARTLAVIRYKGGWSESKFRQHEEKLRAAIDANPDWNIVGGSEWARYNPPMMPSFFRSNEVMIPVASTRATQARSQ